MNRRLLTLFLLPAFAIAAWAQDHSQRLVVWQKSGEKVYFDLAEEPKTTFNNGLLVIKTKTMETRYQLSNILRYTYEGYATGVSEVKKRSLTVAQSNDGMTLSNVPAGTVLRLFDAAGRLLESKTSDGEAPVSFSLTGRPAGVYMVNMNDHTFKILKR